jgi:Flavin containing amine oxidoreductase
VPATASSRAALTPTLPSVGIVGGGIAGLYSAWRLAESGRYRVTLFETLPRLGGRIETVSIEGFNAEFGPMRFEPKNVQPTFHELCGNFGIDFVDFPKPMASSTVAKPQLFFLDELATGGDALGLLRLGILKLFGKGQSPEQVIAFARGKRNTGDAWIMQQLGTTKLNKLRQAELASKPLYEYGLWNALSLVLSHQAVDTIRNRGTFYHFIGENPNALEWAIFWLRAFQAPERYLTIPGGVSSLTAALETWLKRHRLVSIHRSSTAIDVASAEDSRRVQLLVTGDDSGSVPRPHSFDQVILALPQRALLALAKSFPSEVATYVRHSVAPVPMIKAFHVTRDPSFWVKDRWEMWDSRNLPEELSSPVREGKVPFLSQSHELTVPTRESHIYYREKDGHCMRMFYLDRPFTAFWEPLIKNPTDHWSAETYESKKGGVSRASAGSPTLTLGANRMLVDAITRCVRASEAVQLAAEGLSNVDLHLATNRGYGVEPDPLRLPTTVAIGIRNWSASPCGGAAHLWRPGFQSWTVRDALKAFSLADRRGEPNVHICGEAYSDAQGFIEGALTSAKAVVDQLLR